jgi:hypothetical protein
MLRSEEHASVQLQAGKSVSILVVRILHFDTVPPLLRLLDVPRAFISSVRDNDDFLECDLASVYDIIIQEAGRLRMTIVQTFRQMMKISPSQMYDKGVIRPRLELFRTLNQLIPKTREQI